MKNIDKLITALYLAKSDVREEMLSDLVLTALYSSNEPMDTETIIKNINYLFDIEPIKYEVEQCLNSLSESQQVNQKGTMFCLTDGSRAKIHASFVKERDDINKTYDSFSKIVHDIFINEIEEEDVKKLWEVFNEYRLECFLTFGRKAINIFLPYKKDELPKSDIILEDARKKLNSEKLFSAFKKIVVEYPDRLTEVELKYLYDLAFRADRFYSLGIEKEEYEKINNLQIKNAIVFADTNILYTELNLHVHEEKSAIMEIIRIAKEKNIGFRIVYLPKTYKELQRAKAGFEQAISKERFKNSQIRAMLASGNLSPLAKQYYENKLQNNDYPHPTDNITYASDILKQHSIILYNQKFSQLENDEEYLNERIKEYYEYESYYNKLYAEKGVGIRLNKYDVKIEHDVYLRDAIKILKDKSSNDVLKFVCLTTDRSLIQFDQFVLRKENVGSHEPMNPNCMMPSVFLKKIRPLIPIATNNYKKAFLASVTIPSHTFHTETEDEKRKNILTQKSLTYFKNLGIEDEEVICNIMKRELFLEELSNHERDNTVEVLIKTEVGKEIENIKLRVATLEQEIEKQKEESERKILTEKKETEKIRIEKETDAKEKKSEIGKLTRRIQEKEALNEQLKKLKEEQEKFSIEGAIKLKETILEEVNQSILTLENSEKPLSDIIETRHKNYIWRLSIIPVAYFFIISFLIYKLSWNVMEPWTYLSSLFGAICAYLYFAISGKSFSPLEHFTNKKTRTMREVYFDFKFDIEYLNKQRQRKTDLEIEIADLLKATTETTVNKK